MQPVDTLSKGFKRRVGLAQALMHDPRVLVMDEPTDGLDPNQKHHVRALIQLPQQGQNRRHFHAHTGRSLGGVHARADYRAGAPADRLDAEGTAGAVPLPPRHQPAKRRPRRGQDAAALDGVTAAEQDMVQRRWILFTQKDRQADVYRDVKRCVADRKLAVSDLRMEQGRLDEVFREITAGSMS